MACGGVDDFGCSIYDLLQFDAAVMTTDDLAKIGAAIPNRFSNDTGAQNERHFFSLDSTYRVQNLIGNCGNAALSYNGINKIMRPKHKCGCPAPRDAEQAGTFGSEILNEVLSFGPSDLILIFREKGSQSFFFSTTVPNTALATLVRTPLTPSEKYPTRKESETIDARLPSPARGDTSPELDML